VPAPTVDGFDRRARTISLRVVPSYGDDVTASTGPGTALGDAFVRMRGTLERYLRARGAADQAEDLVQELWFKVAALPPDADVSDPSSYLFRMAHNLMLDRWRTEFRRCARERVYVEEGEGGIAGIDPAPAPDRALEARRSLTAVQDILRQLGERTDHIFRRHRVDGIAQRDIAAELGITVSGVEKHLQKAYKALYAAQKEGGKP
jgi:RNA polymerase sigma-70 factor (ECF subfamily)